MSKKRIAKKLSLKKESLKELAPEAAAKIAGGNSPPPKGATGGTTTAYCKGNVYTGYC